MDSVSENLIAFIHALRGRGLHAGPSETAAAMRFLTLGGLGSRGLVRAGLCAILAKSPKEQRAFDDVFDDWFVGRHAFDARENERREGERQRQRRIDAGKDALSGFDVPDDVAEAYAAAPEARQEWMRGMLGFAQGGNRNLPLMKEYLKKIATGWLSDEAGFGLGPADDADDDLLHRGFASIAEDEVPQALRLIELLVRRIHMASERRYRRAGRRGMPDVRATIHKSMRTGGVPALPMYKRRPQSAQRITVLCDISESMVRFSEFALAFVSALGRRPGHMRAFIFSEGIEEIGMADIPAFRQTVRRSALWRRGTDVGGALRALMGARPPALDSSVLLIVLSDAKTIARDAALSAAAEAAQRVRGVIWLNPDRQPSPFAEALSAHATMLRASSIDELARAVAMVL